MWGATVPLIYYGFYCDQELQWLYWSLVWIVPSSQLSSKSNLCFSIQLSVFAIICSTVTFQPRFSDPFLRPLRATTFGSLAFSSIIPMVHGIIKYGWTLQSRRMGLNWILITLGLNSLGAAAYAMKVSSFKLQAVTCWDKVVNFASSFPKSGLNSVSIFLVQVISGSISWSYSRVWLILWQCCVHSIFCMLIQLSVWFCSRRYFLILLEKEDNLQTMLSFTQNQVFDL